MFTCRSCERDRRHPVFEETRDRFRGCSGRFNYVRCDDCGLVQLEEIPEDMGAYYEQYPVHARDSKVYRIFRQLTIGHCYLQEAGHSRALLDIGCGNGWYLKEMERRGWRPMGFEFDAGYARGLSERIGLPVLSREEDIAAHSGRFDLVTFNFSFEHLTDPKRYLEIARRCLKRGGRIAISVPNIAGREARLFGERWFHLDPPRHITFFTKDQLEYALEQIGFSSIETKDLPVPTGFAGSLSYWLRDRLSAPVWFVGLIPGLAFCALVRDGNFCIRATRC